MINEIIIYLCTLTPPVLSVYGAVKSKKYRPIFAAYFVVWCALFLITALSLKFGLGSGILRHTSIIAFSLFGYIIPILIAGKRLLEGQNRIPALVMVCSAAAGFIAYKYVPFAAKENIGSSEVYSESDVQSAVDTAKKMIHDNYKARLRSISFTESEYTVYENNGREYISFNIDYRLNDNDNFALPNDVFGQHIDLYRFKGDSEWKFAGGGYA
jgi:hypothetical protein